MNPNMKKKLNKKWLFSLFSIPLIALPLGLATLNNSNNSVSLVHKSLNVNESTSDSNINLEDAYPVADQSIDGFDKYIVSYEDKNISPVNVIIPGITSDVSKEGGATVGMTENKQTITVTTYAGLLLWSHKLTDNPLLKQYYQNVMSINDITTYKVINFAYLESKSILFVLFGNETTTNNTTTLSNLVVFGLDINSGAIVVPKDAKLNDSQVIAKARDDSAFIFFNSVNQLIVTSGNTITNINSSTKIMSFDEAAGFANVENKGNDEENNNFSYEKVGAMKEADYLLGILPSSVKGVNFSIWLFSNPISGNGPSNIRLSYATSNTTTDAPDNLINQGGIATNSFNYYVVPINDNFETINTSSPLVIVNKNGNTTFRGFLNSSNTMPEFNSVFKRFFITSTTVTGGTTTDNIGITLDSYDEMFTSFIVTPFNLTDANSFTSGSTTFYMNYLSNNITGPQKSDLDAANLPDDVVVDSWELNSVGFDKESNFVYFSLSGEEYNYAADAIGDVIPGKYVTNTRYIDLRPDTPTESRVSSDAYIQGDPYTLSDVNFDTYTSDTNLYLAKQVIDGNDGQWLSTTVTDLIDDTQDFKPTTNSKISFSSLETLAKNLEESNVVNNVMPSLIKSDSFNDFLKEKNLSNYVSFKNVSGNDETGEISFETEITYSNNFGDGDQENGQVSYLSYVQATGFAKKDFTLTFKSNTESAVKDIMAKYSATEIVKTNNVGWVVKNLLTISIKNYSLPPITEDMITLSNPDDKSLKIDINIPIKTSATDTNGILPEGFSGQTSFTQTYNGFTGTEVPEKVPLPGDQDTNNPNSGNGLSAGVIAGIVIGCLAVAAIIIATIVL
ncbi:MAG: hypothetical protein K2H51_02175, partial [Malacoplasma sp.]|nr:hypothetical protein [Malacoplasma sp.]